MAPITNTNNTTIRAWARECWDSSVCPQHYHASQHRRGSWCFHPLPSTQTSASSLDTCSSSAKSARPSSIWRRSQMSVCHCLVQGSQAPDHSTSISKPHDSKWAPQCYFGVGRGRHYPSAYSVMPCASWNCWEIFALVLGCSTAAATSTSVPSTTNRSPSASSTTSFVS